MRSSSTTRYTLASLALISAASAQYSATYKPSATGLPNQTENGQSGTNKCGTDSNPNSTCQNFYINDVTDFCLMAPPNGGIVSNFEGEVISYCTKSGRGTRVFPEGTITGAHFVKTKSYVQVTGNGDFTKIGITAGDEGGELDPHGATGVGNPVGGLVFHNGQQMHEWFCFMSSNDYCFRACYDGPRATSLCRHTYDVLGCGFNAPGNYAANVFESCDGADAQDIMYGYPGLGSFAQDDTTRGVQVPSPHPAPASSNCVQTASAALGGVAADFGAVSASLTSSSATSTSTSSSSSSTMTSVMTSTATLMSSPFGAGTTSSTPSQNQASGQSGASSSYSIGSALPITLGAAVLAIFAAAF